MQDFQLMLTGFVRAHAAEFALFLMWYVLATVLGAVLGHRTQIEAWVARHPYWALVLRVLRFGGCDVWLGAKAGREFAKSKAKVPAWLARILPLVAVGFACAAMSGCFAGTLDESRGAIAVTNVAGVVTARDDARCAVLSDRNTGFKVSAVSFGALAPVLLAGSLAVKSDQWQTGLQIASGASGALSGGAAVGQSYTAAAYVEEGCGK